MKVLIGTNNLGKHIEISEVLGDLNVELLTPTDLGITLEPEETGSTYAENALLKAKHFYEHGGAIPTISDDSGIVIDAIADELGVYTRRWGAGAQATDEEWISYFLNRMREEDNKKARFVCNLAYIDSQGEHHLFEGICEGIITEELEAEYLPGLPISACFKPDGFDKVYSAMAIDEKNAISHRGRSLQFLRTHLLA